MKQIDQIDYKLIVLTNPIDLIWWRIHYHRSHSQSIGFKLITFSALFRQVFPNPFSKPEFKVYLEEFADCHQVFFLKTPGSREQFQKVCEQMYWFGEESPQWFCKQEYLKVADKIFSHWPTLVQGLDPLLPNKNEKIFIYQSAELSPLRIKQLNMLESKLPNLQIYTNQPSLKLQSKLSEQTKRDPIFCMGKSKFSEIKWALDHLCTLGKEPLSSTLLLAPKNYFISILSIAEQAGIPVDIPFEMNSGGLVAYAMSWLELLSLEKDGPWFFSYQTAFSLFTHPLFSIKYFGDKTKPFEWDKVLRRRQIYFQSIDDWLKTPDQDGILENYFFFATLKKIKEKRSELPQSESLTWYNDWFLNFFIETAILQEPDNPDLADAMLDSAASMGNAFQSIKELLPIFPDGVNLHRYIRLLHLSLGNSRVKLKNPSSQTLFVRDIHEGVHSHFENIIALGMNQEVLSSNRLQNIFSNKILPSNIDNEQISQHWVRAFHHSTTFFASFDGDSLPSSVFCDLFKLAKPKYNNLSREDLIAKIPSAGLKHPWIGTWQISGEETSKLLVNAKPEEDSLIVKQAMEAKEQRQKIDKNPYRGYVKGDFPTPSSPTSLETLAQCPQKYWLEYILKVSPEQVCNSGWNWKPSASGNIFHKSAELLISKLIDQKITYDQVPQKYTFQEWDLLSKECFNLQFKKQSTWLILNKNEHSRQLVHFCKFTARLYSEIMAGKWEGWRPFKTEWDFNKVSWVFSEDHPPIEMSGRIDRIDFHPQTNRYLIIDYKTGTPESESKILKKTQKFFLAQIPIYRLAFALSQKENSNIAACYQFVKSNVFIPKDGGVEWFTKNEIIQNTGVNVNIIKLLYNIVQEGSFFAAPRYKSENPESEPDLPCSYCNYKGICNRHPRRRAVESIEKLESDYFKQIYQLD